MALELIGKIVKIMPEVTGQGKNGPWTKQDFVIETTDASFPKKVCMNVWGEKQNELKKFKEGDEVKVSFNVESREYNERWYTDVRAWRIEGSSKGAAKTGEEFYPDMEPNFAPDNSSDDLPF